MVDETPCKCPPRAPQTPAGLDSLPRQHATFAGVRAALVRAARHKPPLGSWRAEDADLGLLLAEGWAYVADTVGFYDAVVADEAYLATAKRARGLTRLLGLLGFRARPGSGAAGSIALTASGAMPVVVASQRGFRSEATDEDPPQVFESATAKSIHPFANGWSIAPVRPTTFDTTSSTLLLEPESGVGLSQGGLVLFRWIKDGQTQLDPARVLALTAVREATGRSLIEARVDPIPPFDSSTLLDEVTILVPSNTASPSELDPAEGGKSVKLGLVGVSSFLLDAVYRALKVGQSVIVEHDDPSGGGSVLEGAELDQVAEGKTEATVIVAAGDGTDEHPDVLAPVTKVFFKKELSFTDTDASDYTVHYGMVRAGRLVRGARTSLSQADFPAEGIALDGINPLPPQPFRVGTFFLIGFDGSAARVDGQVIADDVPGRLRFKLANGQSFPGGLATPVTIRGNVVDVTRGETVANELLGSGDSTKAFLSFKLAREDLTYISDAKSPGRLKSTLQVRVNGILWKEVDSFFGRGPNDEVYIVRNDIEDRRAVVTFGDGIRGRRVPTGTNNIVATYRSGVGATRPGANAINSIAGAIKGVLSVTNPLPAEGGSDPEPPETLRTSAPKEALLLGRLVSVQDFQARVELEPGVASARAEWVWDDAEQRALVRITYIGAPVVENLASSIRLQAEPGVQFKLIAAAPVPVGMLIGVLVDTRFVDSDVVQAVKAKLLDQDTGLFAAKNVGIGQTVYRSAVFEQVLEVPGVVSVKTIGFFLSAVDLFAACGGAHPGDGNYFRLTEASLWVSTYESTDPVHACGP